MSVGEIVAVMTVVVGGLAWLFKLESRISGHEAVCANRQANLTQTLTRIEQTAAKQDAKLDRLVEHLLTQHK